MPLTLQIIATQTRIDACLPGTAGAPTAAASRVPDGDAYAAAVEDVLVELASVSRDEIGIVQIEVPPVTPAHALPAVGVAAIGLPSRPLASLPNPTVSVSGTIDVTGAETAPLDPQAVRRLACDLANEHRLAGMVVTGINSMMNPAHESQAAAVIRETTGLMVLEARYIPGTSSAVERAARAAATLQRVILLRAVAGAVRAVFTQIGRRPPGMQACRLDAALWAALTSSDTVTSGPLGLTLEPAPITIQARITRPLQGAYACHCEDGRYDFESLGKAKVFGETHLRGLVAARAARAGRETPAIETRIEDRYTEIRGRKGPVRVYLETLLSARTDPAPGPSADEV